MGHRMKVLSIHPEGGTARPCLWGAQLNVVGPGSRRVCHVALREAELPEGGAFHLRTMEGFFRGELSRVRSSPQLHYPVTLGTGLCPSTRSMPCVQAGPEACLVRFLISSLGPMSSSGKVCRVSQVLSRQVPVPNLLAPCLCPWLALAQAP